MGVQGSEPDRVEFCSKVKSAREHQVAFGGVALVVGSGRELIVVAENKTMAEAEQGCISVKGDIRAACFYGSC